MKAPAFIAKKYIYKKTVRLQEKAQYFLWTKEAEKVKIH